MVGRRLDLGSEIDKCKELWKTVGMGHVTEVKEVEEKSDLVHMRRSRRAI